MRATNESIFADNVQLRQLQQLVGEISQMKEQAKRMQRQLDTDYKNIHGEYIDCLVKWKVSVYVVNGELESD